MEPPTTGAHLQKFVCALKWVKQAIPNFTELVAPLFEFMEFTHIRPYGQTDETRGKLRPTGLTRLGKDRVGIARRLQEIVGKPGHNRAS